MKKNISILLKCAIIVSFSIVFGKISLFRMPFGGSINLSPIPIIISSELFGPSWGALTGFAYGMIKIILEFQFPPVANFANILIVMVLDYIVPNFALGISSVFKFRNFASIYFSIILSMAIKLLSVTTSGVIIWKNLLWSNMNILVYSLLYNLTYIIPETILAIILCPTILKFVKK